MKFASGDAVTNGSIVGHDTETSQGAKQSGTVAYNTISDGPAGRRSDHLAVQNAQIPSAAQSVVQPQQGGVPTALAPWLWRWAPQLALALVALLALLVGAVVPGGSKARSEEGQ